VTIPTSTAVVVPVATRTWSPGTAAVLSFFIPGLGQLYKGKIALGLVFLIVPIAGYAALILPEILARVFVVYCGRLKLLQYRCDLDHGHHTIIRVQPLHLDAARFEIDQPEVAQQVFRVAPYER
jgi:TM2 domain-containing membrane protein YozV